MRSSRLAWVAFALCLPLCGCNTESQAPPLDPCAPFDADLVALRDAEKEFSDIPSGDDAKTTKYFILAAKLAAVQRELLVQEMVIEDFQSLSEHPLAFGNPGVPQTAALEEKARAETEADEIRKRLEEILALADKNGLPLRDGKGGSVDGGRVMRATYVREVAAQARAYLAACDKQTQSTSEIQKFLDDVQLIQTADAHGLIEDGRSRIYLQKEAP